MKLKKVGFLFLAMVLALGVMGTSYALWYKVLYIDGTVNTDTVDAEWTLVRNYDPFDPPTIDLDFPNGFKTKNVGWTDAWIDQVDPQIVHVEIYNGYPSYYNDLELEYTNTGSVTVKINEIIVTPENFTVATDYDADDGEIWIDMINGIGDQLDPGETTAYSLHIHVEQSALENAGRGDAGDPAAYAFEVEVVLVQWNEYPYTPPYP